MFIIDNQKVQKQVDNSTVKKRDAKNRPVILGVAKKSFSSSGGGVFYLLKNMIWKIEVGIV